MPHFGKKSQERLHTCHKDIQRICNFVIDFYDISVLEGARSDKQQYIYFMEGKSKLNGINKKSKHQVTKEEPLSKAIDIASYPIDFTDKAKKKARFYQMSGYMFMAAEILYKQGEITHKLRWGGDWDNDKLFTDQSFDDLPHFELVIV